MVTKGKPHHKAMGAVMSHLASRIHTVLREQRDYVLRDVDGREVTPREARAIIRTRYLCETTLDVREYRVLTQVGKLSAPLCGHPQRESGCSFRVTFGVCSEIFRQVPSEAYTMLGFLGNTLIRKPDAQAQGNGPKRPSRYPTTPVSIVSQL
jgi:hypothetical protein